MPSSMAVCMALMWASRKSMRAESSTTPSGPISSGNEQPFSVM